MKFFDCLRLNSFYVVRNKINRFKKDALIFSASELPQGRVIKKEVYKKSIEYFSKAFEQAGYSYFDTINEVANDLKNHRDRIPPKGESRHKMIIMLMALQKKDCKYYKIDCLSLYPPETRESVKWL